MNLKFISHVSLSVLVLSLPVLAMEPSDKEKKKPNVTISIKAEPSSDWKQRYLKKKYLFSEPSLDEFQLMLGIKNRELEPKEVEVLLQEAAQRGELEAEERLYQFYRAPYLNQLNISDPKKADNLLTQATKRESVWAYRENAKRAGTLKEQKKWNRKLANRGDAKALEFLKKSLRPFEKNFFDDPQTAARLIKDPKYDLKQKKVFRSNILKAVMEANYPEAIPPVLSLLSDALKDVSVKEIYLDLALKGAEMGNAYCMLQLHALDADDPQDTWLRKAADLGNKDGLILASLYFSEKDRHEEALKYAKKGAELGIRKLMIICGQIYQSLNEYKTSLLYYLEAEKRGHKLAAYHLGDLYSTMGEENKALEYLIKAANVGEGKAAFRIGLTYKMKRDYSTALQWFQRAASLNLGSENTRLLKLATGAVFLRKGEYERALKQYKEVQDAEGYNSQAVVYLRLNNVRKAEKLLNKAAELNNLLAIENLVYFYIDIEEYGSALYWGNIAMSKGSQKIIDSLELAKKALKIDQDKRPLEKGDEDLEDSLDQEIENWDQQMQAQFSLSQSEHSLQEVECKENREALSQISSKSEVLLLPKPKKKKSLNEKGLREKLKRLCLANNKQTELRKKVPKHLDLKVKSIARDLLTKNDDEVGVAQIIQLFEDPFFYGRVDVSKTKSGCKVIAYDEGKKLVLKAGTHKKHGQEKFTGKLHPAFRNDIRKILEVFGFQKGKL